MKTIEDHLIFPCLSSRELIPNYFFVFEGEVTEPYFISSFLRSLRDYLEGKATIHLMEKKNDDIGRTDIKELLKIAKEIVASKKKEGLFKDGKDKVVVFFDLDRFENDQRRINTLFEKCDDNILLAYTNPSFELFAFLLINDSLNKHIIPNKEAILRNYYIELPDGDKERYIFNLFKSVSHINIKSKKDLEKHNILQALGPLENAISQEKLINRYLDCAANNLTSNIGYLLELIMNNKLSAITYKKTVDDYE